MIDSLEYKCKAFPEEIPLEYLSAEKDHIKKADNQIGDFVFDERRIKYD